MTLIYIVIQKNSSNIICDKKCPDSGGTSCNMVPEQTMNRNEKRVSIVLQIRQLLALYGIVVDRQLLIVHMISAIQSPLVLW